VTVLRLLRQETIGEGGMRLIGAWNGSFSPFLLVGVTHSNTVTTCVFIEEPRYLSVTFLFRAVTKR
jgi:hypothetical protein